ncbi:MAG: DNA methyltransferase [Opitutaceae bacterium]
MPDQSSFNLSTAKTGPVECLGQSFPSEEARREHFLKLLAAKLKEPAFRQIEGFPIGTDEAILALSDPPYYTACPNPWLGDFVKHYGTDYDPKKPYHREPFAADVSEGKNHPIYKAHAYPTKVPHRAIMQYILHYTNPGDLILDGFCGTGMTGLAAQLCGNKAELHDLGFSPLKNGEYINARTGSVIRSGARRCILGDLSPSASFISYSFNQLVDSQSYEQKCTQALNEAKRKWTWAFKTIVKDPNKEMPVVLNKLRAASTETELSNIWNVVKTARIEEINYVVWSDVFACSECGGDIIFWDNAVDRSDWSVRESFPCPHCAANVTKSAITRLIESKFDPITKQIRKFSKQVPVLINYKGAGDDYGKRPDELDIQIIEKATEVLKDRTISALELPDGFNTAQPKSSHGLLYCHDFYFPKNLGVMSDYASALGSMRLGVNISSSAFVSSKLYRLTAQGGSLGAGGGPMNGTLYIPSLIKEIPLIKLLREHIKKTSELSRTTSTLRESTLITTSDGSRLNMPSDSVDYIFVDPPFGGNINYSELAYIREYWLGVRTNNIREAITNKHQGKSLAEYGELMLGCFREYYRILKPGRWITVEFSNTQASVWNSIQTVLQEAGFVVANVAALDKKHGSFKAVTSTTAVKQDLVISAYKPNGGLEARFEKNGATIDGVWDFMRTHLRNLPIIKANGGQMEPIAERDPRILYDRMVAFYIGHSTPVPLSSGEFQAELHSQFPNRDGMVFLPEQVHIYDQKRVQMESIGQLSIFVEDERSAIDWVRQFIKERPSTQQDIHPDFTQQLTASWKKWEARPELRLLLDQNFLCYDGVGEVPSQIHSYLSTQFKELRNLDKDHAQLRHKAKDRWYVPDPKKNIDVETLRNKRLLEEFWLYLPEGYISAARNPDKAPTLPGMAAATPRPKVPRSKKLREVRTEAIRVGFKHCYQLKDYFTILAVADMLPESVLNEDEQLQMLYDNAALRSGASA